MKSAVEIMAATLRAPGYTLLSREGLAVEVINALHDAGYAIVPRTPTEAMEDAGLECACWVPTEFFDHPNGCATPLKVWRAMTSAALILADGGPR